MSEEARELDLGSMIYEISYLRDVPEVREQRIDMITTREFIQDGVRVCKKQYACTGGIGGLGQRVERFNERFFMTRIEAVEACKVQAEEQRFRRKKEIEKEIERLKTELDAQPEEARGEK